MFEIGHLPKESRCVYRDININMKWGCSPTDSQSDFWGIRDIQSCFWYESDIIRYDVRSLVQDETNVWTTETRFLKNK